MVSKLQGSQRNCDNISKFKLIKRWEWTDSITIIILWKFQQNPSNVFELWSARNSKKKLGQKRSEKFEYNLN